MSWGSRFARRLTPTASLRRAGVPIALLACGAGIWTASLSAKPTAHRAIAVIVPDPSVFAAAIPSRSGPGHVVELRSPVSGKLVSTVARFGDAFTNNGIALSPDGRDVYVTLIPKNHRWTNLLLEQIAVANHRRRLIGGGQQPAVSPDSEQLAYTSAGRAGEVSLAVRNVASGETRMVDLTGSRR